jgi:hypothetical protein
MGAGTSRRRVLVGIGVALVATAAVVALVRSRESNDEPGVYVHAGPRTTWIQGPLRPDGTVDYVAHARAEMARGVTPENDLAPVMSPAPKAASPRLRPAAASTGRSCRGRRLALLTRTRRGGDRPPPDRDTQRVDPRRMDGARDR